MNSLMRNDLKGFMPYIASTVPYKIKIDANESPYNLTDKVKENIIDWLKNDEDLNIYPDSDCVELRAELSTFWATTPENIMCGVGSDQIIDYITKVFIEPNDFVLVESPSFSMYALAGQLNHAKIIKFDLKNDFNLDIYGIIKTANDNNVKILFLCTPNNPTGNSLDSESIKIILDSVNCVVVIDEAYAEFCGETMIPFINDYKNIVVLRTFSKAYGLAGARVGYAIACKEMIDTINIVKAPYNLNTLSQKIAVEVLKDSEEYKIRTQYLIENKNELYDNLSTLKGLDVFCSDANFIYIETKQNISKALEEANILVRTFENGAVTKIRITSTTKEHNKQVYEVIRQALL